MNGSDSALQRVLGAPSATDRDEMKVELLGEFHLGRPISDLLPLLQSHNGNAVQVGIWISSELGTSLKPLLKDIVPLLSHAEPTVRFLAVDCILKWASAADGQALASAVLLVDDPAMAVRWKALRFLSSASTEQLQAAQSQLASMNGPVRIVSGLAWLLGEDAQDPLKVQAQLRNTDALLRKFGVVAATRLSQINEQPLIEASGSGDSEVRQFAADMLSLF